MAKKKRLDEVLVERGIASDARDAFIIVTEGRVFVRGQKAVSPAQMTDVDEKRIEARGGREHVGRGAYKLKHALKHFGVSVSDKVCADIGAATGGFTEVLLGAGAKKVYAIDTAFGKLALKLREDSRVVVMEKTDIRKVKKLPEKIDIAVADVSLIPLAQILPAIKNILAGNGEVVVLLKPQYEVRDPSMLKGGVLRSEEDRQKIVETFKRWAYENGWEIKGIVESPILGAKGNVEYLVYMSPPVH